MLIAAPGSGKTFLAKRLAQTAGLRFVPFNITQMRSKADLLECLDTIVATQAEEDDRQLMVFIDEINAKLENTEVYGAFLTPRSVARITVFPVSNDLQPQATHAGRCQ